MINLRSILKIRGITLRRIAKEMGVEYCSLQKTAKGRRKHPGMQKVLALYFGVDAKLLFGPGRDATIRYIIEREIENRAESQKRELREKYLKSAS
jgi:transcriptional regulator with XRE-family HTH domain